MKANTTITYTSTLPNMVMEEVVTYAKKAHLSKNKVIEAAIVSFLEREKQRHYIMGFKKIAEDKEMKEMAEEGMKDYNDQLNQY